jgi:hypothetical protein
MAMVVVVLFLIDFSLSLSLSLSPPMEKQILSIEEMDFSESLIRDQTFQYVRRITHKNLEKIFEIRLLPLCVA